VIVWILPLLLFSIGRAWIELLNSIDSSVTEMSMRKMSHGLKHEVHWHLWALMDMKIYFQGQQGGSGYDASVTLAGLLC
jgi:hypothetical protein